MRSVIVRSVVFIFCAFLTLAMSSKKEFIGDCSYLDTPAYSTDEITFICIDKLKPINYFNTDESVSILCHTSTITNRQLYGIMHFRNCQISRIKYDIFGVYKGLHTLNISGIELKYLPSDFFIGAERLTKLLATNNRLTDIHASQFTHAINLTEVDFSFNQIHQINKSVFSGAGSIEKLRFSHNKIEYFHPKAFEHLLNVQTLDLSHNSLTSVQANFSTNQKLRFLDLSHNFIKSIDLGMFAPRVEHL